MDIARKSLMEIGTVQTEISNNSSTDTLSTNNETNTKCSIRGIIIKVLVVAFIITCMILLGKHVNVALQTCKEFVESQLGPSFLPIIMGIVFTFWLSVSPNGSAPTILCSIIFKDNLVIGFITAYLSIFFGALLNLLWVRCLLIRYENNKCINFLLNYFGVNKFRKMKFVGKLFKVWSAIKIIIILRLPYFNAGMMNYLFSFQDEKINLIHCIIGNAIGFVPGCIIFLLFGDRVNHLIFAISKDGISGYELEFILLCMAAIVLICMFAGLFYYVRKVVKRIDDSEKALKTVVMDHPNDDSIDSIAWPEMKSRETSLP